MTLKEWISDYYFVRRNMVPSCSYWTQFFSLLWVNQLNCLPANREPSYLVEFLSIASKPFPVILKQWLACHAPLIVVLSKASYPQFSWHKVKWYSDTFNHIIMNGTTTNFNLGTEASLLFFSFLFYLFITKSSDFKHLPETKTKVHFI